MVTEAVVALIEKVERPYQAGVGAWLFVMAMATGFQITAFESQWFSFAAGTLPPSWSAAVYAAFLFLVPVGSAVIRQAIVHVEERTEPERRREAGDEPAEGEPSERESSEREPTERELDLARRAE